MRNRKIIKLIAINNGYLSYEIDDDNHKGYWYRNGKKIKNPDSYRFYDKAIGSYRRLGSLGYKFISVGDKEEAVEFVKTPIDTPYLNKLLTDDFKERDKLTKNIKSQYFKFGDKSITLKTKGRMNLATIPINMLDSIAINTGRSNTNIATNLGLVGKESTFGGISIPIEKKYHKSRGESTNIDYSDYIFSPYDLTTNHAYFVNNYKDYYQQIRRNNQTDASSELEQDKKLVSMEKQAKDAYVNNRIKDNTPHYNQNFLADSFARYTANPIKYNPGQENYVQMVNNIGTEVWNEPQIQAWWNSEGQHYYNKGLAERRTLESAGKKSK